MKMSLVLIFLANMLMYASVYSSHNFLKGLYKTAFKLKHKKTSLLEIQTIVRLVSAYFIGNLADSTQQYSLITLVCLGGYAFMMFSIIFFPALFNISGFGPKLVAFDMLIKVFDSGTFPIMETLVINAAYAQGSVKKMYTYMRFSMVIGRMIAHGSNAILDRINPEGRHTSENMVSITMSYFIMSVPIFLAAHFTGVGKHGRAEKEEKVEKKGTLVQTLRRILLSEYALILVFVGMQGIHRVAVGLYQHVVLEKLFPHSNKTRYIFLLRFGPDIIAELIAPYVESSIGVMRMILVGAIAGIVKTLVYAFPPKGMSQNSMFFYFQFFEIFKAIFSSFVSYGCTRLNRYYNPPAIQASAQGLYNGMYTAIGAAISGLVGYWAIGDEDKDEMPFMSFFLLTAVCGAIGLIPVVYLVAKRSVVPGLKKR